VLAACLPLLSCLFPSHRLRWPSSLTPRDFAFVQRRRWRRASTA
jgi:hypothetical protein